MNKKIQIVVLAILLAALLVPCMGLPIVAAEDAQSPAQTSHHQLYINGDENGAFRPNATLTRAELAQIVYSLGSYEPAGNLFPDVGADDWYAKAVNALAARGIIAGFVDGRFHPYEAVSRAQIVAILQRVSGISPAQSTSFSDVSRDHWAYNAICVAQQEGWVAGYPDGSFRPNRSVSRAEAVTILNGFLDRHPDRAAIDANPNLRFIPDVSPDAWYYYNVMEACVTHSCSHNEDGTETWRNASPYISSLPNGFYCIENKIYLMENGIFVRRQQSGSYRSTFYTCDGQTGVCTVFSQVAPLANGNYVFLKHSVPEALPGRYTDGFYVRNGQLYLVRGGSVLHESASGSYDGVNYVCDGATGVCTTEDWNLLSLEGVDLQVFADALPQKPATSDSDVAQSSWYYESVAIAEALKLMEAENGRFRPDDTVSCATLLHAAVAVYDRYYGVDDQPEAASTLLYDLRQAKQYGILSDSAAIPDKPVTRAEVAVYLYRALHGRELAAQNHVDALPDMHATDWGYAETMALYEAGVLRGTDAAGSANPNATITRAELAVLLSRLVLPERRVAFWLGDKVVKTLTYGTSGTNKYPLTAYQLGDGENVMVLTFALHGWEDHWERDGADLVYLADQTRDYLEAHYGLVYNGNWTIYILRCVNPDGLYLGSTNNGPGRCTTTYYDSNGNLQTDRGIDMNRCFPYNYVSYTSDRNFNGSEPLACDEARALADFVQRVKSPGKKNILIDTHGWLSQIITSSGSGAIYKAFHKQFPASPLSSLHGGSGYFSSWAAYRVGYDSCLFELPSSIGSHQSFLSSNCVGRFEAAISSLLSGYRGIERPDDSTDEVIVELDGN